MKGWLRCLCGDLEDKYKPSSREGAPSPAKKLNLQLGPRSKCEHRRERKLGAHRQRPRTGSGSEETGVQTEALRLTSDMVWLDMRLVCIDVWT